jgi:hypothetical protein
MTGLGADPVRDQAWRAAVQKMASEMVTTLLTEMGSQDFLEELAYRHRVQLDFHVPDWVELGIEPFDFTVSLRDSAKAPQEKGGFATGWFEADSMEVVLYVLPPAKDIEEWVRDRVGRKFLLKVVRAGLIEQRDVAEHEFIHMLDYLRGNVQIGSGTPYARASMTPDEVWGGYVSRPHEFNAFFQQSLNMTLRTLRGLSSTKLREALRDYKVFVRIASGTEAMAGLRRGLTEGYQRKLDQRLWQTWNHLRENGLPPGPAEKAAPRTSYPKGKKKKRRK